MITSAAEARRSGPIADYIALSRALDKLIWQGIYNRSNKAFIVDACTACNFMQEDIEGMPWFHQLILELEALGYEVSAEGIVSW
jgi:hypothetical protein